jgi:hypothetical protein
MKNELKEGDVIYTDCSNNLFCYHVGIVYKKGNEIYIFHNDPSNNNKFGGTLVFESYENFTKKREIIKIVNTNVKNKDILRVTKKNKYETWDSLFFNCEDYVSEIVEGKRNSDLRDVFKITALGLTLITIY